MLPAATYDRTCNVLSFYKEPEALRMAGRIQIPEDLYELMVSYIADHYDQRDAERYRVIEAGIKRKADARKNHFLYTVYKCDKSSEKRGMARQMYLDEVGMRESFRWGKENQPC